MELGTPSLGTPRRGAGRLGASSRGIKHALKKQLRQAYGVEGELQKRQSNAQDPLLKLVTHKL